MQYVPRNSKPFFPWMNTATNQQPETIAALFFAFQTTVSVYLRGTQILSIYLCLVPSWPCWGRCTYNVSLPTLLLFFVFLNTFQCQDALVFKFGNKSPIWRVIHW